MVFQNQFLFVIIIIISILTYRYTKCLTLYQPYSPNPIKYRNFYSKLSTELVGPDCIINTTVNSNGILLDTWFIQNKNSDMCIIFFHGEKGNVSMRFDMVKFLYNFGSVIIFDYRLYGKSTGDINDLSAAGLLTDANAIWNYCRITLGYPGNMISFFGESLGCSIAVELGAQISKTFDCNSYPHSIILTSPFCSLSSFINAKIKKMGIGMLDSLISFVETEYNTAESIKYINYSIKLIISHSKDNDFVPYSEGKKLFESIPRNHPNAKFIDIVGKHDGIGLTNDYVYSVSDVLQD